MAMSFLLGGIDLFTILLSLVMLFLWSLWACAVCLFLSSAVKSRAMSGAMLAIMGLGYLVLLLSGGAGGIYYLIRYGPGYSPYGGGPGIGLWGAFFGGAGSDMWLGIAATISVCLVTMANLVLLAENCLALEDEDRTFALRVGLFVQYLMIIGWTMLPPLVSPGAGLSTTNSFYAMAGICCVQLLIQAMFMTSQDLTLSRRTRLRDKPTKWFSWLTIIFRPGGGRAIAYLLAQMGVLIFMAIFTAPSMNDLRWAIAFCGYIALFTGLPIYAFRLIAPKKATSMRLRIAMLLTFLAALVLPEIAHYFVYSGVYEPNPLRRLLNPVFTLGDWEAINVNRQMLVIGFGGVGFLSYVRLMMMSRQANKQPVAAKAMAAHG
jgi:hypothetical protein